MDNNLKEILEKTTKEVLSKMDFGGRVELDGERAEFLVIKIESDQAGLLIGQGGENLAALQHLIRAIVNKRLGPEAPHFIIDINSYRAHRLELLKEMALNWARQVVEERETKTLEPMPSYERRVVHLTLSDFKGVETESQGEESQRRVVIKPSSGSPTIF